MAALFEATVANPQHEDGLADPVTVFRWLTDIVDLYAPHPAYLKVDGRPVVMAYAAQRMSQSRWTEALSRLRASGRDVLLIGEGINATRLGALDGLFYYASNEYQGDQIFDFDRTQSLSVRTYHLLPDDTGKRRIWVATVSPGYDDRQLKDGRVPRTSDRDNGRYYDRQWQSAIDLRADWVVVTSWNEWMENTQIESSVRYGELYATAGQRCGPIASNAESPAAERDRGPGTQDQGHRGDQNAVGSGLCRGVEFSERPFPGPSAHRFRRRGAVKTSVARTPAFQASRHSRRSERPLEAGVDRLIERRRAIVQQPGRRRWWPGAGTAKGDAAWRLSLPPNVSPTERSWSSHRRFRHAPVRKRGWTPSRRRSRCSPRSCL